MKKTRLLSQARLTFPFAAGIAALFAASTASAANLYWDTNDATADSGSGAGTWGPDLFWSTDVAGLLATANIATTGVDDLFFSAGTNCTGGTVTVDGSQTARKLTFEEGAITLSGNNDYTGGTTLTAGKLELAHNSAAGTNGITLTGATKADLQINSGITITNDITFSNSNASSSVIRLVAAADGMSTDDDYTTGTSGVLKSSFAGGNPDTTAAILAGTNSGSATSLTMSFSDTSAATNDGARRSDIFNLSGTTGTDNYVVQLTVAGLASDSRLAFWNTHTSAWAHAGTNFFAGETWAFASRNVGDYGFDGTGSAWAVVDGIFSGFSGSFTVIPEPTSALGGLLLTAGPAAETWRGPMNEASHLASCVLQS
ncbi:MAG: hypothetical protein ACKO2G_10140 [Verrucomicrobiales bacterium]